MKKVLNLLSCAVFMLVNWQCKRSDLVEDIPVSKPNIIFLLADDMRYDALGYTGNKLAITPNLDVLAGQGTNFKNTYVTSSICSISRASILTGQYAKRHGIDNFNKNLSSTAFQLTYPSLLRHHGYYTGFIGKYGVGNDLPSSSFDYWKGYPGHGVYFYKDANGKPVHETAMMGQQAKEFIEKRDKVKPFCLSISFKAPHSEDGVTENNGFRPDPYFNNWFSNVQFPYPETYPNSYYNQFSPEWRKSQQNKENEGRLRWDSRFAPDKFQTSYHAIYRLVSGVDKVIGELREYLKANGLDRNTILVFTSDNGYYMGEHGLEGKWYGHEE
ncbi:MAG: sulfatase-like hydrolase/transferase, partial [Bacteroidota bacterium]|nr:sulfatase-like hydrolase/transferase [Bacteroidota bacterium]